MDADREALPDDIEVLKVALVAGRDKSQPGRFALKLNSRCPETRPPMIRP
jgi:hypothetical protein